MNTITFRGSHTPCANPRPHLPHRTGEYPTVRYGWLDTFCVGVAGDPPLFRVVYDHRGDAQVPSTFRAVVEVR